MEQLHWGLFNSHCLSVHPGALSLKGTPSICVNPWAAGDTAGNKHYHCWEWLDIDTASSTPTKPVSADWQRKRGVGWENRRYRKGGKRWTDEPMRRGWRNEEEGG